MVVATLRQNPPLQRDENLLIRTIEGLAVASADPAAAVRQFNVDSIKFAPLPAAPDIVLHISDAALRRTLQEMIARRGWQVTKASNLGDLWGLLEARRVDVVLLDSTGSMKPLAALRAIRHATGTSHAAIIYFGGEQDDAELDLLVDGRVPQTASRDEIFRVIKETIRLIPKRRRQSLVSTVGFFWPQLVQCADGMELARAVCRSACEIGADRCVVQMFDSSGNLYSAHRPESEKPAIDVVPTTFLDGRAIVRSQIDEDFYSEITDDETARNGLAALSPVSGASIPIMESGRVVGNMLVLTRRRQLSEAEFEAMLSLCESASRAFSILQLRLSRAETRVFSEAPHWMHLMVRDCRIDSYRGNASTCSIRMSPIGGADQCVGVVAADAPDPHESLEIAETMLHEIALAAEHGDELEVDLLRAVVANAGIELRAAFAGVVSGPQSRLTFAALGFPAPLQIGRRGPAALPQKRTDALTGRMRLRPGTLTLIYGNESQAGLASTELVRIVQKQLEESSPNPLAAVTSALPGSVDIAVAAITRPSSGSER